VINVINKKQLIMKNTIQVNYKDEILYNYVFHFNPYTQLWSAIPRDGYLEYWSNNKSKMKGVYQDKDMKVLIQIINQVK